MKVDLFPFPWKLVNVLRSDTNTYNGYRRKREREREMKEEDWVNEMILGKQEQLFNLFTHLLEDGGKGNQNGSAMCSCSGQCVLLPHFFLGSNKMNLVCLISIPFLTISLKLLLAFLTRLYLILPHIHAARTLPFNITNQISTKRGPGTRMLNSTEKKMFMGTEVV